MEKENDGGRTCLLLLLTILNSEMLIVMTIATGTMTTTKELKMSQVWEQTIVIFVEVIRTNICSESKKVRTGAMAAKYSGTWFISDAVVAGWHAPLICKFDYFIFFIICQKTSVPLQLSIQKQKLVNRMACDAQNVISMMRQPMMTTWRFWKRYSSRTI